MSETLELPSWLSDIDWDANELLPCITQDASSGEVLMMAWCNREALETTFATGQMHYWSRSRQELWHKGATSGSIQHLRGMWRDCDGDTLLALVDQDGSGACHRGTPTCWDDPEWSPDMAASARTWMPALERLIASRADSAPEGSYVASLLTERIDRAAKKVVEEAGEVVLAAKNAEAGEGLEELASESADLIFHLMVLWQRAGLSSADVGRVLEGRWGKRRR